jgi:hypothetical protein
MTSDRSKELKISCQEFTSLTRIKVEENPDTFMYGFFSKMRVYVVMCIDCYAKWLKSRN